MGISQLLLLHPLGRLSRDGDKEDLRLAEYIALVVEKVRNLFDDRVITGRSSYLASIAADTYVCDGRGDQVTCVVVDSEVRQIAFAGVRATDARSWMWTAPDLSVI